MKKVIAGALAFVLTLLTFGFVSFATIVPASANTGVVEYCQATASDRNPFNYISVSLDSLLDTDGNFKQDGVNANDIVPAFSYINKDSVRKYFDGQNTTKDVLTAADCPGGPAMVIAEPNEPIYTLPSCDNPSQPYGSYKAPSELGLGVASASAPAFNEANKQFSIFYTLAGDTKKEYYQWADVMGETKNYIQNATHISDVNDPMYIVDEKTGVGACELSNTGLFGLSDEATYLGAGLLALGLLFVIGNAVVRRNNA